MHLRYIFLGLDHKQTSCDVSTFAYHIAFINNYLSKAIYLKMSFSGNFD